LETIISPRMIVLDVDDTIRSNHMPVPKGVAERLRGFAERAKISLISGKDASYVLGIADGMGLSVEYAVGEVGGVILQPILHRQVVYRVPEYIQRSLRECERNLKRKFGDHLWFQPNLVNITVLPIDGLTVGEVFEYVSSYECGPNRDICASTHSGMIDVIPIGLDKGNFIRFLEHRGFHKDSMITVGDGENDIPMLSITKNSITFESSLEVVRKSAFHVVPDIGRAFDIIEKILVEE
jgi:hydroxymethylpyrimidine pyrophosphatase-like HAD family hydrolase